ncbi:MAG: UDP-glucose/GDP-mannose dehydrogenase family protein [Bacteroidetes bacterium]|nr:UDP-glucose/GDP-mannose dehydrogenase family protein [Bacteroidia bacterium]MCO5289374.1 UDP-glucose/GDP-mannose dehydrogenase family protein [Bacteroidota bacterium]MCW5932550.1 UDP-glucose/GDP-mannose dehydrogenase family protein [Bacteroidota bacterium]
MNIAVVGTGYVGLVTGTCFAEMGNHVICVDIDKSKVERMRQGEIPIYEPHLDVLFERNIKQNRLSFTTDLAEAVKKASVIFLALPTPPGEDGSADLSYVLGVADQLGSLLTDYKIVINKSTVPVGTAEKVHDAIAKKYKGAFDVISNPEFLREGFAVDDFMKPDRVVIGTRSERAKQVMQDLYAPFLRQGNPIYFMDERSAELTKYAANSFLATKITFMNEIANLCEKVGANVDAVRIGIGADNRIGKRFLFAGIGYGGSCFPKDVQALEHTSKQYDYDFRILQSVMEVNDAQKLVLVEKVKKYFKGNLKGKHFALWGLAFKPDTDDIREAPALYIIDELLKAGATVKAFDPEAMNNVKKLLGDKIVFATDEYDALKDADALLIATEWSLFRTPDFGRIDTSLKEKIIFDGRNLYDPAKMKEMGYYYNSIGREVIS